MAAEIIVFSIPLDWRLAWTVIVLGASGLAVFGAVAAAYGTCKRAARRGRQ